MIISVSEGIPGLQVPVKNGRLTRLFGTKACLAIFLKSQTDQIPGLFLNLKWPIPYPLLLPSKQQKSGKGISIPVCQVRRCFLFGGDQMFHDGFWHISVVSSCFITA
jgi:hypothetical protein